MTAAATLPTWNPLSLWYSDGWTVTKRNLIKIKRSPDMLVFAVIQLLTIRSTPLGILRLRDKFSLSALADSMTPVSADGFRFSDSREYPGAVRDFEKSFAFLRAAPCDILLTSHPEASGLWQRLEGRQQGVRPDPVISPNACKELAERAAVQLRRRLESEKGR